MWSPYHDVTVVLEAVVSATAEQTSGHKASNRRATLSCELSGTERMLVCTIQSSAERGLIANIEEPPKLLREICPTTDIELQSDQGDEQRESLVRPEIDTRTFLKLAGGELQKVVEAKGKAEMARQTEFSEGNIKQTKIEKLQWRIDKDESLLFPLYEISYCYGAALPTQDAISGRTYVFLVNGVTGKYWGERPYGMGSIMRSDRRSLSLPAHASVSPPKA